MVKGTFNGKYQAVLTHPIFIALILSVAVIWLVPPGLFHKYKISIAEESILKPSDSQVLAYDLDSDGLSELVFLKKNVRGECAVKVYNNDKTLIGQYDLPGTSFVFQDNMISCNDCNCNGYAEIYIISEKSDSVFLHSIEPLNPLPKQKRYFLTTINKVRDAIDYTLHPLSFHDIDKDGFQEVLCTVNAGFSMYPRCVFAVNIQKDTVISSPYAGVKLGVISFYDLNGDSLPEVLACNSSRNNIKDSLLMGYHDTSARLLVFDHKLKFLFNPVNLPGRYTLCQEKVLQAGDKSYIAVLQTTSQPDYGPHRLMLFNTNGDLLRERKLDSAFSKYYLMDDPDLIKQNHLFLINYQNGIIQTLDQHLKLKNLTKLNKRPIIAKQMDCDGDGSFEWLILSEDQATLKIFRKDFRHPADISIVFKDPAQNSFYPFVDQNGYHILAKGDRNWYLLDYLPNPFYFMKYLQYPVIFLVMLALVLLIQKAQKIRYDNRLRMERLIAELQLKNVKAQLDPHFTINVLNTISSVIYKDDWEKAMSYFSRYARMVRSLLEVSDKISRTLQEEVDFVSNYMDIEKMRYRNRFTYKFEIDEEVNRSLTVPKMIIQTYAENAVKHGLRALESDGVLLVEINQEAKMLTIIIRDNGIGRAKALELGTRGTGKGFETMQQIFSLYEKLYKTRITQEIEDLNSANGTPAGTRVTLKLFFS